MRLVLFGALVGLPAALLAAAFLALVHALQRWLWTDLPALLSASSVPWYLILGLPIIGAGVVVVSRMMLPGDGGHSPLAGLSIAPTPAKYIPGVLVAALGSLGFGAVLGPEAPLIVVGCATGTVLARLVRRTSREVGLLAAAGAFSAISTIFGGPLIASFLLIEASAGLGAAVIPTLLPGLVAAAVGYLIFVGLGPWGGIKASALAVPGLPGYHGTSARDLGVAVLVGVVAAVVVAGARSLGSWLAEQAGRFGIAVSLFAGGLFVGLLALAARGLGANSQDVLFSGQPSMPALAAASSAWVLVVLVVAKAIGYAICLGCGFRGGPMFPAIFLGVAVAMIPAVLFHQSPTVAVAAGAAAGMAAAARLPFSAVLFAVLLVGGDGRDTVPAAILAAASAWLVATAYRWERRVDDDRAGGS